MELLNHQVLLVASQGSGPPPQVGFVTTLLPCPAMHRSVMELHLISFHVFHVFHPKE